jgi:hypothetical protein
VARMIRKQLKRRPRLMGAQAAGRRTLASGVIALVAIVSVGGAAFARPVGPGGSSSSSRDESVASRAEDFVNNYYGFGDAGETEGTKVAPVAPDSPVARPEQGLSTEAVAITFFTLLLLVTGVTIMFVRRGNYRPAT